jgi:hypothetical protein
MHRQLAVISAKPPRLIKQCTFGGRVALSMLGDSSAQAVIGRVCSRDLNPRIEARIRKDGRYSILLSKKYFAMRKFG